MLHCTLLLALAVFQDDPDATTAAPTPAFDSALLQSLEWRSLGPANMGGRIVDLAVDPTRKSTFYVATASGGLWKTTTNGTKFFPVFERENTVSLGAVAVAPSNPAVVWVGTGEANPRNSVSWGDGVYRSKDGGKTWEHKGLDDSRHVGAVAIHPADENLVFVAAVGHTWGPNEVRGLYRTRDGGDTWERVLYVDEHTGAIDVVLDPRQPATVYAATYQRQRDEFDEGDPAIRRGPGSGLWRSDDGGESWQRLTEGLPTENMGRIGLDLYLANTDVVYALIETERTGDRAPLMEIGGKPYLGVRGEDDPNGYFLTQVTAGQSAEGAGLKVGDVLMKIGDREITGVESLRAAMQDYVSGDSTTVEYLREGVAHTAEIEFGNRPGGGSFRGPQGGQNANVQDAQGPSGHETGGLFRSADRGATWTRVNSINPRPFYYSQVRVDPQDEKYLYVLGIELHMSEDGGARFEPFAGKGIHPDHHALWIDPDDPEHLILGNDGGVYVTWDRCQTWDFLEHIPVGQFYNVAVDGRQPYHVYGGLQDNGSWGGPNQAPWRGASGGVIPADWFKIGGGDGFHAAVDPSDPNVVYSESQNGFITRRNLATGEQVRVRTPGNGHRFNWNTPFFLSPHNPDTLYFAGEEVFRSVNRGEDTTSISPGLALTRTDRGTATALCESPRVPEILYVGTDDGSLWCTQDGGRLWELVSDNFPEVPGPWYVSDVEASRFDTGTVFVTLDGHRNDDYAPYVLVSDDFGRSWEPRTNGLPEGSVRCIEEDPSGPGLLYCGTEFGLYVSLDTGANWVRVVGDLPTVAVHDLALQRRDSDLVLATHGRGLWILDVAPLQQLGPATLRQDAYLFDVEDVVQWVRMPTAENYSSRTFVAANPPVGARLYYYLREDREEEVKLTIKDVLGNAINELRGPGKAGLHLVRWNLRTQGRRGGSAEPGEYVVILDNGDAPLSRRIRIHPEPTATATLAAPWMQGR